ncbi:MAG: hypothetical protein A2293_10110 [Elusimicrobia bacterium RIFOXYB2_FULL_49_7]|nr:MAG: hypothetical protein A2293_10110 [Elusimicrobia bacterium RIFOXYB2_FULL_49_7]
MVPNRSKTTVENFQTTYDFIETRSEGILLPSYQIIDIGYIQDGTCNVVLTGKIRTEKAAPSETAEFHYEPPVLCLCLQAAHRKSSVYPAYFESPYEFSGTLTDKRDFETYPKGFTAFPTRK